ncbi:hypothetical protein NX059_007320 [Plenodomus lindquistii]|nr:hypothetical protein NX059_007320 [Plenodomus lindquistii]
MSLQDPQSGKSTYVVLAIHSAGLTDPLISDSKSSSGTQFSSSRPYTNGQHGSTSTLPSSTDTSSDDNLFANVHRPPIPQHSSSPVAYSVSGIRKQLPSLPSLPRTSSGVSYKDQLSHASSRSRAMTTSSYASTAIPPKLESNLNFESSSFDDDMFSHINPKPSPEMPREPAGRSLLSEKRTFQAEPIKIHPKLDVEPPLKSWDSRGSADNLMSSPRSDNESPPPPPPPHHYSTYAPVALDSPTLQSSGTFQDSDAHFVRKSFIESKGYRDSSPEQQPDSNTSSSAHSYDTPYSSRSATASSTTTNTTPKAPLAPTATHADSDEEEMFTPNKPAPKAAPQTARKVTAPAVLQQRPTSASTAANGSRVMTQSEFREYQKRQLSQPNADESSDDDDYEDEEDAIKKREEEEVLRRKNQQMHFAREAMRRSTTAPGNPTRPESSVGNVNMDMGFPSEVSMKADEWEDDDVPLGILAQHGFPSQARNRLPNQPPGAMPSYIPDRPASAGALGQHTPQAHMPAFARGLPADPYSPYVGGGIVRHANRESLGFNGFARGPTSIAGDSLAGGMGVPAPMMYQDAGLSQPSLVDQIQMRDMHKPKYMGGASNKRQEGGPFTGILGQRMNPVGQQQAPTRMPQMPLMNPMMGMQAQPMGGQMPMMGMGMGMGMNPMGFPMQQQTDYNMQMQQFQQMQQMIAMQQFQMQQMQAMQNPLPQQDPRMTMATANSNFGGNMMGNGSFLSVPGMQGGMPNQQGRPMSFMSGNGNQQQPQMQSFMGPGGGYTPSIAPSERSNIGLSARYRPVVNHSDSVSNGTSMTLQASGGAAPGKPGVIKGILKKGSPQPQISVRESDEPEEDWGKLAARKNKAAGKSKENDNGNGLEELTRGLNI